MKGLLACLLLLALAVVTVTADKTATIRTAGKLKCGTHFERKLFGEWDEAASSVTGYDADYCRAIAAVVFAGTSNADTSWAASNVEWVGIESVDKVSAVVDNRADVVVRTVTDTLGRRLRANVAFSPPVLNDGQSFLYMTSSGVSTTALLDQTKYSYCVDSTSTSFENAKTFLSQASALTFEGETAAFEAFVAGKCTVFTSDASTLAGFKTSAMSLFTDQISREPLAAVTSKVDALWSDTVAWTVRALVTAERWGLTQADARALLTANAATTSTEMIAKIEPSVTTASLNHAAFRDFYTSSTTPTTASLALLHAVATVGHFGEVYARHLEASIPRASTANAAAWLSSSPGLIDSAPFHASTLVADTASAAAVTERTLASIKTRGTLLCALPHTDSAVSDAIFMAESTSAQSTSSMSYVLCAALKRGLENKALATADVVQSTLASAATKLADGSVDVTLLHMTAKSDIQNRFSFSQPVFVDGVAVLAANATAAAALAVDGTFTYCVLAGSDTVAVAARYLTSATAVEKTTLSAAVTEMDGASGCTVIVGMRSELLSLRPASAETSTYTLASFDVGAPIPVCVATRQSDVVWSEYVRWVVNGVIIASQTSSTNSNVGVTKAVAAASTATTRAARSTEVRRMMGWTSESEAGGAQTTNNFGFGFTTLSADFMTDVISNHGNLVEIYTAAVTSVNTHVDAQHKFYTTSAPAGRYFSPPWNSELLFTTSKAAGWWTNVDSDTCAFYNISSSATNSLLYADDQLGKCTDEFDFLLGRGRTVCEELGLTWLFVYEFLTDPTTGELSERYATNINDISVAGGDVYPTTLETTSTYELSTFKPCDAEGAASALTSSRMSQLVLSSVSVVLFSVLCAFVL